MIPGLGAGMRLGWGYQRRNQIAERTEELKTLSSTPAVDHYQGVKRFEVATVLSDVTLGFALDGASEQERKAAVERYLAGLEKEYVMAQEQATSAPATKAEVFALGLALKEVALSFDDTTAEFKATADEQLAGLRTEAAALTADVEQRLQVALTAMQKDATDHAGRLETEVVAGLKQLKVMMVVGLVVLLAALVIGQLLGT